MTNDTPMPDRAAKQPFLRGATRQLGSPYEHAASLRSLTMLFPALILIGPARGFGAVAAIAIAGIAVAFLIGMLVAPRGHHRLRRSILALQKSLPWFAAHPVTCHPLPPDEQLDTALAAHGFERIDIDGTAIATWHDLSAALQPHTTPMRFPEQPRAHVLALLAQMSDENPKRAIVWRDAAATAANDLGLLGTFLGDWAAHAPLLRPGILLFVDVPAVAELNDVETRLPRGPRAELPDRSILAHAPDGAWWKPRPGELTHSHRQPN